jgi:proteic killer suppression protein
MNAPSWDLHSLSGNLRFHWSVTVSGNWRVTFRFEEGDVVLVDYHWENNHDEYPQSSASR